MRKFLGFLLIVGLAVIPSCKGKEKKSIPVEVKISFDPPQLRDAYVIKMKYTWLPKENFSLSNDYWVYVHFWDKASKSMYLVDDHKPPVDFSQWKPGNEISYERLLVLPEYIEEIKGDSFAVDFSVGFYNPKTKDKIEVYKVPLSIKINSNVLPQKVYAEGWYSEETDKNGTSWRWMGKTAICRIENPKKTSLLYLDGFYSEKYTPDQKIRVYINDHLIDEITEGRFKKSYIITPDLMGEGDEFILKFEAEKTFVPSKVVEGSKDSRELAAAFYKVFFCIK